MWGPTSINHFQNLHNHYLKKNHIVHIYAEPLPYSSKTSDESMWYFCMREMKDLVYVPFKFYIHPQGDFQNGYGDFCSIQKGPFDYDNMKLGEVFPVILYAHHETILTVGCVVKTSDHPDVVTGKEQLALYTYYPSVENIEVFEMHSGHIREPSISEIIFKQRQEKAVQEWKINEEINESMHDYFNGE